MKDQNPDEAQVPDEALLEFMEAFHKLWTTYERVRGPQPPREPTGDPCDPFEPVECPGSGGGGGLPEMCRAINAWAECWKAWGDEVHKKLWPGPNPTPPPPRPPFF